MATKNHLPRVLFSLLIGLALIGGGYLGYKTLAGMKADPQKKEIPKRIKAVEARTVANTSLAARLDVQGRLQAYNKIDLFTEVGGTVLSTGKAFKKGVYFSKGETLLRIDDREARLQLQSQKATLLNAIATSMPDLKIDYAESFPAWEAYLNNFNVDAPLQPLPTAVNQREKLFVAGRNLYSQFYAIKSAEERLSKYVLPAPFGGVLTEAIVDQGAVVRPGQRLGELMATGYYEMVATVPLSELEYLKPGGAVDLYSEDIAGKWRGKVRRISDQIDAATQTVNVYVGVSGKGLREGMYLRGEAEARTLNNVVEINRDLLIDEREVYVVEQDTLLRLLPVTVEKFTRETAIVSGLPTGAKLLVSEVAGAYDGMRVKLRSDASTTAERDPPAGAPVTK